MDAKTKAQLFEPFFTTKEGKGTGLGLATVYGIVKQSAGYIAVETEPGRGAAFTIYLPRVAEPVEPTRDRPTRSEVLRGTETVLLIEDEDALRDLAREVLKAHGYRVLEAPNGPAGLEVAEHHSGPIHMAVTDVVMPEMSGHDFAHRLLQTRPATKVLYMPGYTGDAIVRHGVLDPGAALVQKPFTPDALVRKVREVLGPPRED